MDFAKWRSTARMLLAADCPPESANFSEGAQDPLFPNEFAATNASSFTVPPAFLELAQTAALHRDPGRWRLHYRILWRIVHEQRHLMEIEVDPDVRELMLMAKAVARDIHKMHAFVRFRKVEGSDPEQFVAWHRPDHHIVEHVGPWFARRFGAMHWSILTPDRSAFWDTRTLRFGPGVPRFEGPENDVPAEGVMEELWRSYYAAIFNPARVNVKAMTKELPVRHWATLPEAELIPRLLLEASAREGSMREAKPMSAEPFVPEERSLRTLSEAVSRCQGCDLYRDATHAVFGEGRAHARIMLVGEQPGDQEDLQGKPFVGPAGRMLDKALAEAGIDRSQVYVTNAVKHFKFEERGKRRIHKKPRGVEIAACRPWLSAEMEEVNPAIVVALGATAALSVGGREFAIQKERGRIMPLGEHRQMLITVHPSYLLRLPDADREAEFARFVDDLRLVA